MSNQNTDTLFSQIPTVEGVKTQLVTKTRGDKYIWGIVVLLSLISILVGIVLRVLLLIKCTKAIPVCICLSKFLLH